MGEVSLSHYNYVYASTDSCSTEVGEQGIMQENDKHIYLPIIYPRKFSGGRKHC